MSEAYWDGALWAYHANITNDGVNAGSHTYTLTLGAGNEMDILYGSLSNDDGTNRLCHVQIDDGTNVLTRLLGRRTITANSDIVFPQGHIAVDNESSIPMSNRVTLAGGMRILATAASIAVSEDSAFGIVCRIRGGLPTVALASPVGATETVDINQVF